MLLATCTTQVKKESKKEIQKKKEKKKKKNKVTKNLLQADSNQDPQAQLGQKVNASIHWTTSVNADKLGNSYVTDDVITLDLTWEVILWQILSCCGLTVLYV